MIEADIYQQLSALAGGNVFAGVAAQGTQAPFIVITRVSGQHDWALAGATGARRYQMQVDCYASTLYAAEQLADQAFDALAAAPFGVGPVSDIPFKFDESTGLHRAGREYTIQT